MSEPYTLEKSSYPLLPLRDIIVFPHMVVPLFVGREPSIAALEHAMENGEEILLAAQKEAKTNDPSVEDIYEIATVGSIIQLLRLPDGTVKVLVEGKARARITGFISTTPFFHCSVESIEEVMDASTEVDSLIRQVQATFESYVKLNKRIPPELLMNVASTNEPGRLADTIVAHLNLKLEDKQSLLEVSDPGLRLQKLFGLMQSEIEILLVENKIRGRVKKQMEKSQKEYYLNEQMQAIQKELGERDEFKNELQELEEKIKSTKMSAEATTRVKRELKKLKMMSPMSAEATVVRNYIDWVLSLPWFTMTQDQIDIVEAEGVLNSDHYGLEKAKERILEYLAVQSIVKKLSGPILCLVGPPGVGKTSLAKSVARSTGRKYVRLSLGGVRDEAEIRGHRRTYIGALPGKIIQSLKKSGSNNPVFLLDEVDKMSLDFRGDPSSALLEVLDPEQNNTFNDHYLDLDYDLSSVMFITTANSLHSIPLPLRDRMEVIEISGYTEFDKLQIAKAYLVPKQLKTNGLEDENVTLTDPAIKAIINHYTKEAGVRSLERSVASIFRKIARKVVSQKSTNEEAEGKGKKQEFRIGVKEVQRLLGPFIFRHRKAEEKDEIGLVNGLAVTSVGGDLLNTEVTLMPGKGKLTLTGKLGDVMQESTQAALSYIRSRATRLGLHRDFYQKIDLHVHCPEGAIPKDGPSAGITMATALASALTRIPVRRDVAMTGEITLRGRVLPIGGLKEKVIAAHRGGIKTVIMPAENAKDIRDIPKQVLNAIELVQVEHMDEVLKRALLLENPEEFMEVRAVDPEEDFLGIYINSSTEEAPATAPTTVTH